MGRLDLLRTREVLRLRLKELSYLALLILPFGAIDSRIGVYLQISDKDGHVRHAVSSLFSFPKGPTD